MFNLHPISLPSAPLLLPHSWFDFSSSFLNSFSYTLCSQLKKERGKALTAKTRMYLERLTWIHLAEIFDLLMEDGELRVSGSPFGRKKKKKKNEKRDKK